MIYIYILIWYIYIYICLFIDMIYIYIFTYIHTYIHAYIHAYIRKVAQGDRVSANQPAPRLQLQICAFSRRASTKLHLQVQGESISRSAEERERDPGRKLMGTAPCRFFLYAGDLTKYPSRKKVSLAEINNHTELCHFRATFEMLEVTRRDGRSGWL